MDRVIEQWTALKEYFNTILIEDNSLPISVHNINNALKDNEFKIYLEFLSYTLNVMCKMNAEFQSEKPKIHRLHSKMEGLYVELLQNYMQRSYITSLSIQNINPEQINHYLNNEEIYVGPGASIIIERADLSKSQQFFIQSTTVLRNTLCCN